MNTVEASIDRSALQRTPPHGWTASSRFTARAIGGRGCRRSCWRAGARRRRRAIQLERHGISATASTRWRRNGGGWWRRGSACRMRTESSGISLTSSFGTTPCDNIATARPFGYTEAARLLTLGGRQGAIDAVPSLTPKELSRLLPASTALLLYYVLPESLLTWIVTPNDLAITRRGIHLGRARPTDFATASTDRTRPGSRGRVLSAVSAVGIGPAGPSLRSFTRLIIVPDGPVNEVPFACLYDADAKQYFVERHSLVFAPNALTVARSQSSAATSAGERRLTAGGGDLRGSLRARCLRRFTPEIDVCRTRSRGHRGCLCRRQSRHQRSGDQTGLPARARPRRRRAFRRSHADQSRVSVALPPVVHRRLRRSARVDGRRGVAAARRAGAACRARVVRVRHRTALAVGGLVEPGQPVPDRRRARRRRDLVGDRGSSRRVRCSPRCTRRIARGDRAEEALQHAQLQLLRHVNPALRDPRHWAGVRLFTGARPVAQLSQGEADDS